MPNPELRFGALAGLSRDIAQSGQPWLGASRIGVENLASRIEEMGNDDQIFVEFVGREDSRGTASGGIEARRKLTVSMAPIPSLAIFSPVTVAAGQYVSISEEIISFAAGTAAARTDLDMRTGETWLWCVSPPDPVQGPVLAQLLAETFGADATINIGARNARVSGAQHAVPGL